ncbi:MAG: RusA family crossover junction endodeoxyribonuclease [Phycisphaerales bacterium JB065]
MSIIDAIAASRERGKAVEREKKRSTAERRSKVVVRDCLPWRLWVPGRAAPQPRPKAQIAGRGSRPYAKIYTPSSADAWKARIGANTQAVRHPYGLDESIEISLVFSFIRPESHLKKDGTVRDAFKHKMPGQNYGDWDNLAKAVCDALGDKGVYINDADICFGSAKKVWGEVEGCLIVLDALRTRGYMILDENGEPRLVEQESIFGNE